MIEGPRKAQQIFLTNPDGFRVPMLLDKSLKLRGCPVQRVWLGSFTRCDLSFPEITLVLRIEGKRRTHRWKNLSSRSVTPLDLKRNENEPALFVEGDFYFYGLKINSSPKRKPTPDC